MGAVWAWEAPVAHVGTPSVGALMWEHFSGRRWRKTSLCEVAQPDVAQNGVLDHGCSIVAA